MFCVDNPCTDVYFNLAAEEYLLKKKMGNYFMLWQNAPSVVVGKHQSVPTEVDLEFAGRQGISVARRFSGGGAVYHDLGNINLTFIEKITGQPDFDYYLQQTIDFLNSVGIVARGDKRLGLYIDELKISGSAQCIHKDRMMYHCTLLFSTDLEALEASLRGKALNEATSSGTTVEGEALAPRSKVVRAVPSVRSEVTNICRHLPHPLDTKRFMRLIFRYFLDESDSNRIYRFTPEDHAAIERLKQERYSREEWVLGMTMPLK